MPTDMHFQASYGQQLQWSSIGPFSVWGVPRSRISRGTNCHSIAAATPLRSVSPGVTPTMKKMRINNLQKHHIFTSVCTSQYRHETCNSSKYRYKPQSDPHLAWAKWHVSTRVRFFHNFLATLNNHWPVFSAAWNAKWWWVSFLAYDHDGYTLLWRN